MLFRYLIVLALSSNFSAMAQPVNAGGGGPWDISDKAEKVTAAEKAKEIKKLAEIDANWIKLVKEDWKTCYTSELDPKIKNVSDLYVRLAIQGAAKPPQLRKEFEEALRKNDPASCEAANIYSCLFKNKDHNMGLQKMLANRHILSYLSDTGNKDQKKGVKSNSDEHFEAQKAVYYYFQQHLEEK